MDGVSEVYSVSGPYDLLVKCHLEEDVGHFVNEKIHLVGDVIDTSTIITFNAFS
jgi:DNA-binding Lrp family transcriptional regulator